MAYTDEDVKRAFRQLLNSAGFTASDADAAATELVDQLDLESVDASGDITTSAGDIEATTGSVTGGTGVTATAGGLTATAGDLTVTAGKVKLTTTAFSTEGPTDNVDVSGTSVLLCDCSSSAVTIGGLAGGVAGQVLYVIQSVAGNALTLEDDEGGGSQDITLASGADEAGTGWTLICNGSKWIAAGAPSDATGA